MSHQMLPEIPADPPHPKSLAPHPVKQMLMSPLVVTLGGMLAFMTVVVMVVVLPTTTFEPEPSETWRPLTSQEMAGRQVFLANGCYYCHSGFVRPQDIMSSQYYLYPRAAEPGDYVGEGESPNLFGSMRTGPDLSQAGGFHPDDWHYAHFNNPRFTVPMSIMPRFNFLSQQEVLDLVAFIQGRGGQLADLRAQHQQNLKALELALGNVAAAGENGDRTDGYPSAVAIRNLMLIEPGYWFEDNPLPITNENLLRGRMVFQERCIGCHGSYGDGNGPAAFFLNPPPADFTVLDDQQHGSDTSPGDYYWRILRGLPGTAMENFGTQLSVDDIWRVTMFLKTINQGGLTADIPTTDMYTQWQGYPGLFRWVQCFAPAQGAFFDLTTSDFADLAPYDLTGQLSPFTQQSESQELPEGLGDVAGMVAQGEVNPVYAVSLWMIENNARPCGSRGHEDVTLVEIMEAAQQRGNGYAVQGVDQIQFIPASMLDQSQLPPNWGAQVWMGADPYAEPEIIDIELVPQPGIEVMTATPVLTPTPSLTATVESDVSEVTAEATQP